MKKHSWDKDLYDFFYPTYKRFLQQISGQDWEALNQYYPFLLNDLIEDSKKNTKFDHWELDRQFSKFFSTNETTFKTRLERTTQNQGRPLKILYVTAMFPSVMHGGGLRMELRKFKAPFA